MNITFETPASCARSAHITARVPESVKQQLRAKADKHGLKLNELINQILNSAIAQL